MTSKSILIIIAGLTLNSMVYADATVQPTTTNTTTPTTASSESSRNNNPGTNSNVIENSSNAESAEPTKTVQIQAFFCPKENELVKDKDMMWTVGTAWRSFSPSFVKKVGTFTGAQWTGINFGKIICMYQGENAFEFPIALEQRESKLFLRPQGHNWNLTIDDYIICRSNSIYDCPFYLREEEEKILAPSKIYEQVAPYKGTIAPVNPQ